VLNGVRRSQAAARGVGVSLYLGPLLMPRGGAAARGDFPHSREKVLVREYCGSACHFSACGKARYDSRTQSPHIPRLEASRFMQRSAVRCEISVRWKMRKKRLFHGHLQWWAL
jgi:hypothetical protein